MSHSFDLDKRRYIRYEVLDYAQVATPARLEPVNAVIVDIGLGGLQLRCREHLPIGMVCRIQVGRLDLPPLSLRAEVRHTVEIDESDLVAVGMRFVPDTHEERIAIAEYVHGIFQRQCDLLAM